MLKQAPLQVIKPGGIALGVLIRVNEQCKCLYTHTLRGTKLGISSLKSLPGEAERLQPAHFLRKQSLSKKVLNS